MKREEAILNAAEIANILDKRGLNGAANSLRESLKVLCTPRNPWVKTADRLPEGDDFDIVLVEYASDGLILPTNIGNVRDKPYLMPWWMPIPPLPDHIADAGKKEEDDE